MSSLAEARRSVADGVALTRWCETIALLGLFGSEGVVAVGSLRGPATGGGQSGAALCVHRSVPFPFHFYKVGSAKGAAEVSFRKSPFGMSFSSGALLRAEPQWVHGVRRADRTRDARSVNHDS